MPEQPLVSIITLSYNISDFIIKALECIKRQTYSNIENIIIDDCSTDNSVEIIEQWIKRNNYKCTFIKHRQNKGAIVRAQEGLELAKGKYFFGFSDDLCTDDRVEKQVKSFNNDDTIAFVHGNCNLIDENDNYLGTYLPKDYIPPPNPYLALLSLDNDVFCNPSLMYSTEILKREGGFNQKYSQGDYDIFLRITRKDYKIVYRNDILVDYRIRQDSFFRDKRWSVIMRIDNLKLFMTIQPRNDEENNALNKGFMNVLKGSYYLTTFDLNDSLRNDLFKMIEESIIYMKKEGFILSFYDKMFLALLKNRIPYRYSFKLLKTLNPKFKI